MEVSHDFLTPPREFSVMPFWFWNDALDRTELIRQLDDFERHGVYGFVIPPRVGLPRELGWMSNGLLEFYKVAIEEACRRDMKVLLYDEAMYPSGSSSGQVVATNPAFACRCLAKRELAAGEELVLAADQNLVALFPAANGSRLAIIDRKVDSVIRGVHYIGEGPNEDEPAAGDLLNPDAVAMFLKLVYDTFAESFSGHFGKTVMGIFTDEPSLLGRCREQNVMPGTTGILAHVNRILGYDFTPHLPALWDNELPHAEQHRTEYFRAVRVRLEETYYAQLSGWCARHGVALAGHPEKGDDIGVLRYFHIPGQDVVWRWILPDHPTALEGAESTQAKCSSSAAIHGGRRRNGNECCGAYGHELTWEEMCWLANWCLVRGVNLLYPHAFYYSVRGVRRDERPPDVGPNAPWWPRYSQYADSCRRLCWLNTDAVHVCDLAILGKSDFLPWRSAKACFRNQRDFNYLEESDLARAVIDDKGIHLAGMTYCALIVEHGPDPVCRPALESLELTGRVIRFTDGMPDAEWIGLLNRLSQPDVQVEPGAPALRIRHLQKSGYDWYLLFNEEKTPLQMSVQLSVEGEGTAMDPVTGQASDWDSQQVRLAGHELRVVMIKAPDSR